MSAPNIVPFAQAERQERKAKRRGGAGGDGGSGETRDPPGEADPQGCPVVALGHRNGMFVFFNAAGELREMGAQALGQSPQLVALFGARIRWAISAFPQRDKDGEPTGWFSARAVNRHLVEACYSAGLFRSEEPKRGVGIWRAGDQVVVHAGASVLFPGESWREQRAGFRAHGALWPAAPSVMQAPASEDEPSWAERVSSPCDPERAAWVEELIGRWNWEQPSAPAVFFGLLCAGLLGAALRWRPHGLVVGPEGSGKSTLMELYAAASPLALVWNDYTEPGLRQALSGRGAPVVLDEAEDDKEGQDKMRRTIMLLRRASGGRGAVKVQGGEGGRAQVFEVNAAAVLGAILPPDLEPQDASRITRLDLGRRVPGGKGLPSDAEIQALRELAPSLLGRALAGMERFTRNLDLLRKELMECGCAPRLADQVGTILAARQMMLSDDPLEGDTAAHDLVEEFRWLAVTEAEMEPDRGPAAALAHLLQSPADLQRHGERPSIGTLVMKGAMDDADGEEARRILSDHGLELASYPKRSRAERCLYVANKHPRLSRIFEGTRWGGGKWREDLGRLPGAIKPPDTQWVGASKTRCVIVPAPLIPKRPQRSATLEELQEIASEARLDANWVVAMLGSGSTAVQARRAAGLEPKGAPSAGNGT
jgi:hypothetical protein